MVITGPVSRQSLGFLVYIPTVCLPKIEVLFVIDVNGILNVKVQDKTTGENIKTRLPLSTNDKGTSEQGPNQHPLLTMQRSFKDDDQ